MEKYRISYVITTYNKLPYLRQVVERAVAARQPDEEIVVADGGSKDGTPEYLQGLYDAGQIQQFVSARDKGESHGFNRGVLMARGELIKLITDDDAFCYPAIRLGADFMMQNPEVDALYGETWLLNLNDTSRFVPYDWAYHHYMRWLHHREPGTLIGLSMLLRRKTLAITGLFHPAAVQADGEYSLRLTSLKVNIAWMSQVMSIRIENPQSNARNMSQKAIDDEVERMLYYYNRRIEHDLLYYLRLKSPVVQALKKPLAPLKAALQKRSPGAGQGTDAGRPSHFQDVPGEDKLTTAFRLCDQFMHDYNAAQAVEFTSPKLLAAKA